MATRIVLIHATPVAIAPIEEAFERLWPEAETSNLLDDSLSSDLAKAGEITPHMTQRFVALAKYAEDAGADGILYTCSAFGSAIEEAARNVRVPVLKPNEAMIDDAIALGRRVALIATFEPALDSMRREFEEGAKASAAPLELETIHVEGALEALRRGDEKTHDQLIARAAQRIEACDVVALAQFSMARARDAVAGVATVPVLTTPDSAVQRMKALVGSAGSFF